VIRRLAYVAAVSLFLIVALGTNCRRRGAPGAGQVPGLRRLDFDRATGRLSLQAERASLLGVLRQLKERHQIEVTVPRLADAPVTADIRDTPLRDALRQFLPADSRFYFSVKDLDLEFAGRGGDRGEKSHAQKRADLPAKGRVEAAALPAARLKPRREEVRPAESTGRGGKAIPRPEAQPPAGRAAKVRREQPGRGERYARLNLFMDGGGVRRVERFLVVEGKLVEPRTVDGQLVFAAFVGNDVVAVGSVQDPLARRSYQKGRGHSYARRGSGTFVVSLPGRFLDENVLRQTTVRFFLLSAAGTYPQTLTPETFPRFREFLQPAGEIGGDQLLEAFYRARREGGR
jgi:hypothetical protein